MNNTGGNGGLPGYYDFVHRNSNTTLLPKIIRRNGVNGKDGENARTCQTKALDVKTESQSFFWFATVIPGWTLNTNFFSESIDDPNCPDKLVSTPERVAVSSVPKILNANEPIMNYKLFLKNNLQNSNLRAISKTIQKSIELV